LVEPKFRIFIVFISYLGGNLGLFTGISILSLVELAFWLAWGILKFLNKGHQMHHHQHKQHFHPQPHHQLHGLRIGQSDSKETSTE